MSSDFALKPFDGMRIIGVYFNDTIKRNYIWLRNEENTLRRSMPYARYLLAIKIGRELAPNEIAHHKDHDCTNDSEDNLELMTKAKHYKHHMQIYDEDTVIRNCEECGKEFSTYAGSKTKCCSRDCGAIFSGKIRKGKKAGKYQGCEVVCLHCRKKFSMTPEQQRKRVYSEKKGLKGPFCSLKCSATHRKQT